MARQPILIRNEQVLGYELLFRDGVEDYFQGTDADAASRSTVDTSILMGLDILCDGRHPLRLLQAISRNDFELKEVDDIIKGEASLCFPLLPYLNSAAFGFSSEIASLNIPCPADQVLPLAA